MVDREGKVQMVNSAFLKLEQGWGERVVDR